MITRLSTIETRTRTIRVALAGAPNVGKSTIFNNLTGLHQHVGNWPGKTIERKEGTARFGGYVFHIVDLPGTYSLTCHSPEEQIARSFILTERPDVIVGVVDAATLERSLYLISELLPMGVPVVLALNMMDVAVQAGIKVEPEVLEAALGIPVVPMSAARRQGVDRLMQTIVELIEGKRPYQPRLPQVREDHTELYKQVVELIAPFVPDGWPVEWVAMKILDGDSELLSLIRKQLPDDRRQQLDAALARHDDAQVAVASGRYEWIGRMVRAAVVRPQISQIGWTERIDRWATHPVWGVVLLLVMLSIVFLVTYYVGVPLQDWLDRAIVQPAGAFVSTLLAQAPAWIRGLAVDGVITGMGTVLTFTPILIVFFTVLALLEDIGYLARAAFVMDRFMHLIGLHGKSFLPLVLGVGCNVPAVLGTRVVESSRARLLTLLLVPFVPCTARLAVLSFLGPVFFGAMTPFVLTALLILNVFVLLGMGLLLNRLLFKGRRSAFIMELPLYHRPNWRTIAITVWHQISAFFKKAGTVIFLMCVFLWAVSFFPRGEFQTSYMARLGAELEPVARLFGWDWRLLVGLLGSFPAKENAIATLAILFNTEDGSLASIIRSLYTAPAGLSFLTVLMLFIPCMGTLAAIRQETRSWGWVLWSAVMMLAVSTTAGLLIYRLGLLIW